MASVQAMRRQAADPAAMRHTLLPSPVTPRRPALQRRMVWIRRRSVEDSESLTRDSRSQGESRSMTSVPSLNFPRNVTSFLRPRQDI